MVKLATKNVSNVDVEPFSGLLVEYVKQRGARAVIRGLRAISDFEYELQMALINRKLDQGFETVFFMPSEEYSYLTSSIVKEVASLGGALDDFVHPKSRCGCAIAFGETPHETCRPCRPYGSFLALSITATAKAMAAQGIMLSTSRRVNPTSIRRMSSKLRRNWQ